MKVEHIAIAVKNLSTSKKLFTKLLGTEAYKEESVPSEGVTTLFFQAGSTKIELLEATNDNSPISKFLEKRGEGIHHIAFEVADIDAEMERLKGEGFTLLSDEHKPGADNKRIVFLHPKTTNGVLVELCQEIK